MAMNRSRQYNRRSPSQAGPAAKGPRTRVGRNAKPAPGRRRRSFVAKENASSISAPQADVLARAELIHAAHEVRARIVHIEGSFRHQTHAELECVYRIANGFSQNRAEWSRFAQDPFWDNCKRRKPSAEDGLEAMMLFLLRFAYDVISTDGPRYNRVYKYSRTLCAYASQDVSSDEVASRLADEGTEYAFTTKEDADAVRRSDSGDVLAEARVSSDEASRTASDANQRPVKPRTDITRGVRGRTASDDEAGKRTGRIEDLQVEIDEKHLEKVLGLRVGQRAELTIERVGGPTHANRPRGYIRIVAREVRIPGLD